MQPDAHDKQPRVALIVEREVETKSTAKAGFESVKARDLITKYGENKGTKLIAGLKSKGRWYWDPEFPQAEEDTQCRHEAFHIKLEIQA